MKKIHLMYQHLKALEIVAYKSPERNYINGVHIKSVKHTVEYIATDGHRLIKSSHVTKAKNDNLELTIPLNLIKALKLKASLINQGRLYESNKSIFETATDKSLVLLEVKTNGDISLTFDSGTLGFKNTIRGCKVEGDFVDYKRVLPKKYKKLARLVGLSGGYLSDFKKSGDIFLTGRCKKFPTNIVFITPEKLKAMEIRLSEKVKHNCGDKFMGVIMPLNI